MHICTYMVTVGVYRWDSVGRKVRIGRLQRLLSLYVSRLSASWLPVFSTFTSLYVHKYRFFWVRRDLLPQEVPTRPVCSVWAAQPCSGEVWPDGGAVAPRWGSGGQDWSRTKAPGHCSERPRYRWGGRGASLGFLDEDLREEAAQKPVTTSRNYFITVLHLLHLHCQFFVTFCSKLELKIPTVGGEGAFIGVGGATCYLAAELCLTSLRITHTGESVITVRRTASRGPNVGSTSPSAIPFWKVPATDEDIFYW